MKPWPALAFALLSFSAAAVEFRMRDWNDPDAKPWEERAYTLPAYPEEKNLIEYDVSAAATSKFYIDLNSIDVGAEDGVVRYVMVVKTSGGSRNVSHEGLRCKDSHLKLYAVGRADGTWAEVSNPQWRPMKVLNRHQLILARNYFCPNYVAIFKADEGRDALRRGMHPDAPGAGN